MAINPFRIGQLEIPANPQQRPIDFSGLATLGEGLGRYREQQQVGELLAGAIDPATGQLDFNKAAKVLAGSGRADLARPYIDAALRQQGQAQTVKHQEVQAELERERNRIAADAAEAGRSQIFPEEDQLGVGPRTFRRFNPKTNSFDRYDAEGRLIPPGPAPAPAPGPRSEAPVAPGPAPAPNFADRFGGETGAPYQVAALGGGAPAAPTAPAAGVQTAQAAPVAAGPEASPAWAQVPPAARETLKAILAHQIELPEKGARAWFNLARSVDPNYDPSQFALKQKEAARPERQFSADQIKDMTEAGGTVKDTIRFVGTFKPEYSGIQTGGQYGMTLGHYVPDLARKLNPNLPEAASWWQGYESFKNNVRKEIFGATLTAGEKAAFDRANITPGMDPRQAERFLAQQQLIATNAMKRRVSALISEGYNPKTIESSLGLDLKKDLGVTVEGKTRGALGGSAPKAVSSDADVNMRVQQARDEMKKGFPRAEAVKLLESMGVPNANRLLGD